MEEHANHVNNKCLDQLETMVHSLKLAALFTQNRYIAGPDVSRIRARQTIAIYIYCAKLRV